MQGQGADTVDSDRAVCHGISRAGILLAGHKDVTLTLACWQEGCLVSHILSGSMPFPTLLKHWQRGIY